jgi:hypothetical protein
MLYGFFHGLIAIVFLMAVLYNVACYFIRRPKVADRHSSIYTLNHVTLNEEDGFKEKAIRDAIDVVEEDLEPISSATSETVRV